MEKVKNTLPRDFYISLPSIVLEDTRLTSTDKLVYALISSFSLNEKGYCFLKYRYLAHYANIKKRNLYKIIKKLIILKYIEKIIVKNNICLKPYRDLSEEMKNKNRQKIPVDLFDYDWLSES